MLAPLSSPLPVRRSPPGPGEYTLSERLLYRIGIPAAKLLSDSVERPGLSATDWKLWEKDREAGGALGYRYTTGTVATYPSFNNPICAWENGEEPEKGSH